MSVDVTVVLLDARPAPPPSSKALQPRISNLQPGDRLSEGRPREWSSLPYGSIIDKK